MWPEIYSSICNPRLCRRVICRIHSTRPPDERRTLVQDLKYRFRIKAAQKHSLNEASIGITALNRVTVEDVRNIWIHRIIADAGLPSYKVNITREIVDGMEDCLKKRLKKDEDGCVQYENFLPTMVFLIRLNVSEEDEEEIVDELLDFWINNKNDERDVDELRVKATAVVTEFRNMQKLIKLINIINPD